VEVRVRLAVQGRGLLRIHEFGPVRLKAFGSYVIRVQEPAKFLAQLVGTNPHFTTENIAEQLRSLVTSRFIDAMAEGKVPMLDLAARYDEMGVQVQQKMQPDFSEWGLELTKFVIESISLPDEVTRALDKRSSMGVIGNLGAYTQYQTAEAIRDAAQNPGGTAGAGVGMGMGFAMAQQMANALGQQGGAPAAGGPPPLPAQSAWFAAVNGQQSGPHPIDALGQQAGAGTLTRDTLVWKQGMAAWTPAGQVEELAPLFGAAPPPLPPQ